MNGKEPEKPVWRQTRGDFFIRSFQIDGLCAALRHLTAVNLEPGQAAKQLLKALREGFLENSSGQITRLIPEVSDTSSTADLVVIAEVLRATVTSFLSPEELEERGKMGFSIE